MNFIFFSSAANFYDINGTEPYVFTVCSEYKVFNYIYIYTEWIWMLANLYECVHVTIFFCLCVLFLLLRIVTRVLLLFYQFEWYANIVHCIDDSMIFFFYFIKFENGKNGCVTNFENLKNVSAKV